VPTPENSNAYERSDNMSGTFEIWRDRFERLRANKP
jgi:hypothetical protein